MTAGLTDLAPGAALGVLAAAALKATLVLAVAGLASLALRRRASAARHAVWLAGVVGALVLPPLALALPAWHVPLALERPAPPALPADALPAADVAAEPPAVADPAPEPAPPAARPAPAPAWSWAAAALAVWALGALVVAARAAAALMAVRSIVRGADRANGAGWDGPLARAAGRLGLAGGVRLLVSGRVASPATWGVWSPVVLLPAEASSWPAARREAVLLHELAHVRRRDCATQLAAQLACAVYWFNPLVWAAAGLLRAEREHAADDCVLGAGVRASEYASLLLDAALAAAGGPRPLPAHAASFASARRSHLERRVRAVLDPDRPRRPAGRAAALAAVAAATVLVAPLAAPRPSTAEAAAAPEIVADLVGDTSAGRTPAAPAPHARAASQAQRDRAVQAPAAPPEPPEPPSPADRTVVPSPSPAPRPTPAPTPGSGADLDAADAAPAPGDTPVVAALKEALGDKDAEVRRQAAWALKMIKIGQGRYEDILPRTRMRTVPRVRPNFRGGRPETDTGPEDDDDDQR